ncbi:hypothetical protein IMCC1989_2679 [gamma proteobacterium IMCC1989]|nr:hypothetical protein IMCC1989_2679 [gamma proteobacterium IMCC1989]
MNKSTMAKQKEFELFGLILLSNFVNSGSVLTQLKVLA